MDSIRNTDSAAPVDVAVAIITRPTGDFLLAQRPQGKPYAGYWEFPGGKLEAGEGPLQALQRELQEELGIQVNLAYPWVTRIFSYPHANVRLHFYRVLNWSGEPNPKEDQKLAWQSLHRPCVAPLLPANAPILRALSLPNIYAVSNAEVVGSKTFMKQLEIALQQGLRFFQLREKNLPTKEIAILAKGVVGLAHEFGARVLINSHLDIAINTGADGVHYTSAQLNQTDTRPGVAWFGASCHNAAELERAVQIGADFVVLGPVAATPRHSEIPPLGWEKFSELVMNYPLPVYALGGLTNQDLTMGWKQSAHGISMLRGAWPEIKSIAKPLPTAQSEDLSASSAGI